MKRDIKTNNKKTHTIHRHTHIYKTQAYILRNKHTQKKNIYIFMKKCIKIRIGIIFARHFVLSSIFNHIYGRTLMRKQISVYMYVYQVVYTIVKCTYIHGKLKQTQIESMSVINPP